MFLTTALETPVRVQCVIYKDSSTTSSRKWTDFVKKAFLMTEQDIYIWNITRNCFIKYIKSKEQQGTVQKIDEVNSSINDCVNGERVGNANQNSINVSGVEKNLKHGVTYTWTRFHK